MRDGSTLPVWRHPVVIVAALLLILATYAVLRDLRRRLVGWRDEAETRVKTLYRSVHDHGAAAVDTSLLRDGFVSNDFFNLERDYGPVRAFHVVDASQSGDDQETVRVSVTRGSSAPTDEIVTVDSDGLIVSANRLRGPWVSPRKPGRL